MGDEEGGVPYSWTSAEPLLEGVEEAPSGPWVKAPGKAKVTYPNGDTFEGSFNEKLEKHGRGVYTWGTGVGNNPWVPEEGFPGAWAGARPGPLPPAVGRPTTPRPLTPSTHTHPPHGRGQGARGVL
jgi:hypothetical protein